MAFRSGVVFVLLYAIHAGAAKTTLSPELTNLLPSCALPCFTSFLDFNFALTKCGINPTLDCLCTTKSVSEYTVGEGAVQCVLSTAACIEGKNQDAAAFKAYTMCDGKKGSLPNTHATLTATMVIESSTTSSASSSPRTTATSNFSASTTITAITTDASVLPSTLITTTQSFPPPTTSLPPATSTSASTVAQTTSETPVPTTAAPLLNKNQTIGVTVGASIGALAIIGLIIFACLRRRRYQRSRDSDMLPFQLDPSNDLNYGHGFGHMEKKKIIGPGGTFNGVAGKVAPKVPMRIDTQSPNMFSRKSLKPDMIGVAISPETKQQRRASRLLPDKPTLTLTVPEGEKQTSGLSYGGGVSGINRQSTATQFEEDFDSADTAVAADDSWGRGSNDLLYPPPAPSKNLPTVRKASPEPTPPIPAFFIAGGARQAQATTVAAVATLPTEYVVKPLNLTRSTLGSFSQPRKPDDYPSRTQKSQSPPRQPLQIVVPQQPQSQPQQRVERPTTTGSSVYSVRNSLPGSENGNANKPLRPHRSYKASGPYDKNRHQSSGSLTSFETVDSAVVPSPQNNGFDASPQLIIPQSKLQAQPQKPVLAPINTNTTNNSQRRQTLNPALDLSPVVESPSSPPSGRSPVSYPKIPARGRLPEHTVRMVPPPAQPDFNAVFHSGKYAPQRRELNYDGVSPEVVSPMIASATPIENSTAISPSTEAKMKPWRVAELRAQREREARERERDMEPKSAVEPMSAVDIQIGMVTPALPEQNGSKGLQSFRAGTGEIWNDQNRYSQSQQGNSNMAPPRIQPQQQQQQRRQQQERNYLAPSAHFNTQQTQYQNQNQRLPQQQPLQQQLNASYQSSTYNDPSQSRSNNYPLPSSKNPSKSPPQIYSQSQTLSPQITHTRSSSVSSTASSLLAKRRGEQKGKALALNLAQSQKQSQSQSQASKSNEVKWRVLDQEEKEKAKSGAWRPKIGNVERGQDGRVWLGMDPNGATGGLGSGDLPLTPGWLPKLTPTRRGDDLFLSVA